MVKIETENFEAVVSAIGKPILKRNRLNVPAGKGPELYLPEGLL